MAERWLRGLEGSCGLLQILSLVSSTAMLPLLATPAQAKPELMGSPGPSSELSGPHTQVLLEMAPGPFEHSLGGRPALKIKLFTYLIIASISSLLCLLCHDTSGM